MSWTAFFFADSSPLLRKHIHKSLQELAPRKGQQERYRDNNVSPSEIWVALVLGLVHDNQLALGRITSANEMSVIEALFLLAAFVSLGPKQALNMACFAEMLEGFLPEFVSSIAANLSGVAAFR